MNFFTVPFILNFVIVLSVVSTCHGQKPRESCICPLNYSPVCGSNGKTYGNDCQLNCEAQGEDGVSVTLLHNGECKPRVKKHCACPKIYYPVCGSNGKTYANQCQFRCATKSEPDLKLSKKGTC